MRTQLSTRTIAFLLLYVFTAFTLVSCEKSETKHKAEEVLDLNLFKSAAKYSSVLAKRETGSEQTFTIESVKRENDVLKIGVKGGCSAEAFKIIWDGSIMESHPAQVRLILSHEPIDSTCGTTDNYVIAVNLAKIIGARNPSDFIFHVANGSIKEDKSLNPNGSVSSH